MDVFLLAGQSNMQGFGKIDGYPVLSDPRIFNLATGHAEQAVEPLHHWHEHPYMPDGIGLGLAMPFALEVLKEYPDTTIGFIPSARGGSNLDQWLPGHENFERAIFLCERALKNVPDGKIAGILWHQGEADSSSSDLAETYGKRFLEMVNGFREKFQAPDLPIIAGETCRVPEGKEDAYTAGRPIVTQQTREATRQLSNAVFVTSEGLSGHDGHTHFNTESIREYGLRYAAAYLKLIKENEHCVLQSIINRQFISVPL